MRIHKKLLAICMLVPLAVGGLSALLTSGGMADFESLDKPALMPAGWLFPVAWTALYILMRAASYLTLPYLLWTAFAGYLNLGVYLLN